MNDDTRSLSSTDAENDFAALLREMPLRGPSMSLDARIERECQRETMGRFSIWWKAALAMAAMLAVGFGIAVLQHRFQPVGTGSKLAANNANSIAGSTRASATTTAVIPKGMKPIRVIRTLSAFADDGIIGTIGGEPMQQIRQRSVEQIVIFDPGGGTRITYRHPVEQVALIRARTF